ncbi:MAG: glutamine synthetase III [Parachlamydiales bacterium]|jgi:glutamine synthetase
MNCRVNALSIIASRPSRAHTSGEYGKFSKEFGSLVFNRSIMQKMFPKEIFQNIVNAADSREKLRPEYADTVAVAMKEWAMSHGATHYTHWFQPLTNASAEKHDAFIDWGTGDKVIEKFSGRQLIQGEPDASSFPSGGLRSTYEARGYTGWDPTSPVFLWEGGDGITLCIPSVFFSWTGDVLDNKIPLLRSEQNLNNAVMRLLKKTGIQADFVNVFLGLEQEYFVIDRLWRDLRPDILLTGRTLFGRASPKGQELQDHYFGCVKDRVLAFMQDFEIAALRLGIPVRTRHNEVAPAQHEVAPVYERASLAIDHNILLMELMRHIAGKHNLSCLLHEKPFKGLNGSGKHCNWSIGTNNGINLLDPNGIPDNNLHFLVLQTAIMHAVYKHSKLLRASIGTASNDYRLGGHEAPPAIMSIYLGGALEELFSDIESTGTHTSAAKSGHIDLGHVLPTLNMDNTDRNRTSPIAFTGNKFEFRALGSSASPSTLVTVLNTTIAQSLNEIMDKIDAHKGSNLTETVIPVLQEYLKASKGVRFSGDNYSEQWRDEAAQRGLPNISKSIDSFDALKSPETIAAFKGILTPGELASRFEVTVEHYAHILSIEYRTMLDIFYTKILPVLFHQQHAVANTLGSVKAATAPVKANISGLHRHFELLVELTEAAIQSAEQLNEDLIAAKSLPIGSQAKVYANEVQRAAEQLRKNVDELEGIVDDTLWQLPKYRELLFIL